MESTENARSTLFCTVMIERAKGLNNPTPLLKLNSVEIASIKQGII